MKKMTDKQKRIIAYIIAVWFAIFGTLGMVQTGLNIANCAGRNKETKKAYAAESTVKESTTFRFNLANIYNITTEERARKWKLNKQINIANLPGTRIDFKSNNKDWKEIGSDTQGMYYTDLNNIYTYTTDNSTVKEAYRNIEFTGNIEYSGYNNLFNWLEGNATPVTKIEKIEQSTQQIEFIFTANSITIQIYNANKETTYIGNWQGTTVDGWNSTIGSYNTKPIKEQEILQREGFSLHLSPQNISNLSGQIQPTYIPTKAEMTIYEEQIKFKFGLQNTTEESEYIQIKINKSEPTIKFIPENTVYQNSLNTTGYTQGYQDGFKQGQQEKEIYGITQYNKGKQDGIADANKYTFKGLISAVFDVPVQTLYGMLNFNILGINVLSFIMSILSVILLIAIVKVFL